MSFTGDLHRWPAFPSVDRPLGYLFPFSAKPQEHSTYNTILGLREINIFKVWERMDFIHRVRPHGWDAVGASTRCAFDSCVATVVHLGFSLAISLELKAHHLSCLIPHSGWGYFGLTFKIHLSWLMALQ